MSSEQDKTSIGYRIRILIGDEPPFSWARRIGIPKGTFHSFWHKGADLKGSHLAKVIDKAGVAPQWLLMGTGPMFPASSEGIVERTETPAAREESPANYDSAPGKTHDRHGSASSVSVQQKVDAFLAERTRTGDGGPVSMSIPASIQPVVEAVVDVMKSDDQDAIVSLALNAYTFQGRVRYKSEVEQLKHEVAERKKESDELRQELTQMKADMDAIRRQILEPREADFKISGAVGKIKTGGGNGD